MTIAASTTRRIAVTAIGLLTAVPISVGFYVSWGALHDSALAAHVEPDAARWYPLGVDGLIAVALMAALVLRHNQPARRYCLAVLAAFTLSSLTLNIAHGQGAVAPGRPLAWQLSALVSVQAVAAIGFGCHLLVHVLRLWFPALAADGTRNAARRTTSKPAPGTTALGATAVAASAAGSSGNAAVLQLQRQRRPAPAVAKLPGEKTAAIRQFRDQFRTDHDREPTVKECAGAGIASERMCRKVLTELREAEASTQPTGAGDGAAQATGEGVA